MTKNYLLQGESQFVSSSRPMRTHTRFLLSLLIGLGLAAVDPAIPAVGQDCSPGFGESYGCPISPAPKLRGPDRCSATGGSFTSNRSKDGKSYPHNAVDLNASQGTLVTAIRTATVTLAQQDWGEMGNTVILDHGDGSYSVYGHLNEISVKESECVRKGGAIGTVGYSGNAECLKKNNLSAHLHLMTILAGKAGLGKQGLPVKELKDWGTIWQREWGIEGMGPQSPGFIIGTDCWLQ